MPGAHKCNTYGATFQSRTALKQHIRTKHTAHHILRYVLILGVVAAAAIYLIYSGQLVALTAPPFIHQPVGGEQSSEASLIMHIHPVLEIYLDDRKVPVPGDISIDSKLWASHTLDQYGLPHYSPLHTHNATGIIHIESTVTRSYTLGEFFDVWGVPFTDSCLLNRYGRPGSVKMFVNGTPLTEFRAYSRRWGTHTSRIQRSLDDLANFYP